MTQAKQNATKKRNGKKNGGKISEWLNELSLKINDIVYAVFRGW